MVSANFPIDGKIDKTDSLRVRGLDLAARSIVGYPYLDMDSKEIWHVGCRHKSRYLELSFQRSEDIVRLHSEIVLLYKASIDNGRAKASYQ